MVQQVIKTSMALLIVLGVAHAAFAADIRAGAIMQVKPNSIWFDEAADLAQWQELKKKGDESALAAYEKSKLGSRDAWQFINPLTVKVLGYQQRDNQVAVEMKTKGRFEGLKMFLDAGALAHYRIARHLPKRRRVPHSAQRRTGERSAAL
jgi:hypothetical protein